MEGEGVPDQGWTAAGACSEPLMCLLPWQVNSSVVAAGACSEPLRWLLSWQVSSSVVAAVLDLANLPSSVSAILPLNVPNCRVFSSFDYT